MHLYPGGNPTPPHETQMVISLVMGLIFSGGIVAAVAVVGFGIRYLLRRVLGEDES